MSDIGKYYWLRKKPDDVDEMRGPFESAQEAKTNAVRAYEMVKGGPVLHILVLQVVEHGRVEPAARWVTDIEDARKISKSIVDMTDAELKVELAILERHQAEAKNSGSIWLLEANMKLEAIGARSENIEVIKREQARRARIILCKVCWAWRSSARDLIVPT